MVTHLLNTRTWPESRESSDWWPMQNQQEGASQYLGRINLYSNGVYNFGNLQDCECFSIKYKITCLRVGSRVAEELKTCKS